jgi:oligoendopeptidase F
VEARVRRHPDALTAELFKYDVDPAVYRNLLRTVRGNLGPLHRLLRLRKRMLGLGELHPYDLSLSVVPGSDRRVTFEEARQLTQEATAPLGPEYAALLRRAFEDRWIDIYPNKDKDPGGSSSFARGVHPYVLLNFRGTAFDTRTLAHELGHALNYFMADASQPFAASAPSWFLSEVPSNFNEILLLERQLKVPGDDRFRLETLSDFLDMLYFNIYHVTLWAELDLAMHERVEQGGTLTPEWLNAKYLDLVRHYYGHTEGVTVVDDWNQNEWIEVGHFYRHYAAYLYTVGAVTSLSLADKVLQGGEPEAAKYLAFLKAGGSRPPLDLLNDMGVDLTRPGSVEGALRVFDRMVGEMENAFERVAKQGRH